MLTGLVFVCVWSRNSLLGIRVWEEQVGVVLNGTWFGGFVDRLCYLCTSTNITELIHSSLFIKCERIFT